MAKRTDLPTKPDIGDQLPPSLPPTESRPFWLGWAALILVIMIGGALIVFLSVQSKPKPVPVNSAPPASAAPTASGPSAAPSAQAVPVTTYEAFAALPSSQQQAVMQAAIDNYDQVVSQALRTLNPGPLPQVATGGQLTILRQAVEQATQRNQPESSQVQATLLHIVLSPQPYSFVSIDVQQQETAQDLNPTTFQPTGPPVSQSVRSSFSLIIEGGAWKVRDHIQEPAA